MFFDWFFLFSRFFVEFQVNLTVILVVKIRKQPHFHDFVLFCLELTFYCRKRIFTCKSNLTSFFKVYFERFFSWNRWNQGIFTIFSQIKSIRRVFSKFAFRLNLFFSRFLSNKSIWRVFQSLFIERFFMFSRFFVEF